MNSNIHRQQQKSNFSKNEAISSNEYHAVQFSEHVSYACDAPYPPIQIANKNPRNLQTILSFFSSPQGEFTSLTQYCYEHWILSTKYPELSQDLMGIAKIEMYHFDILGQLITLLGGDPKYAYLRNNRATPWNGFLVSIQKEPKSMLLFNIKSEQDTINNYLHLSKELKDPYLSAIFKRLALDEEVHLNLFRKHLSKLYTQ